MYEAVFIAATGLTNQQRRLDTIADNVSNVNTYGFKASRLDFKDAMYTAGIVPAAPRTAEGNQQKGHGVMVAAITKNLWTGNLYETGNQLDFSIDGEGYFEIGNQYGQTLYTRGGNFYIQPMAGANYLVNASGYFVHDSNGNPITVPEGTHTITTTQDGLMTFTGGETGEEQVQLGLYTFTNLMGLESVGNGNYIESIVSGERRTADDAKIIQGYMEGSNVDLGTEMTRLVRTQRAFSLASRALTTADDMEGIANNLRK